MRLMVFRNISLLVLGVVGIATLSYADSIVTVPVGLAPGSQYRLVFVTAHTYTATSSNIADYNNDVNDEANAVGSPLAALDTTWLDIGSTSAVNAIDNIGQDTGVPIYTLAGQLVADDATTSGLFAGSIPVPINYDEFGVNVAGCCTLVWTGTRGSGVGVSSEQLGATGGLSIVGELNTATNLWIALGDTYNYQSYELYGISGILTVPGSSTPEPSTTVMVSLGGAILLIAMRRKHRTRLAAQTTR